MDEQAPLTLLDYLQRVPDFRRAEGRRYPLPTLLVMIIMALMCGRYGYRQIARFHRQIARFLSDNRDELVAHLGLERSRMPSHVTIRTVLMRLDFEAVDEAFRSWAADHLRIGAGAWIAVDAKAISSTVSDYDKAYQDFASLVSAFTHEQGLVLAAARFHNGGASEVHVAESLIEALVERLGLRGAVFTLDALHCKKNGAPDRRERQ